MKAKILLPALLLFPFCVIFSSVHGQPVIGGYNVYYGSLHNHCNASDGTGTPAAAYSYARNTAKLDFFGLADHSNMLSSSEWTAIKSAANAANVDGAFAAFYGFEWTTFLSYGHVAVINTTDFLTGGNFSQLVSWVNARSCIAFFNHPGWDPLAFSEFSHFTTTPSAKFVGMELWNDKDGFSKYYYNDGYYGSDGDKGYFDEALARGWKPGAAGSDDNHTSTWGTSTPYRVGVLANTLSRTSILEAFNARRFYATVDKNLALSFTINWSEMGSTVPGGSYNAVVKAFDGDNEAFNQVVLVKNGVVVETRNLSTFQTQLNETFPVTCVSGDYFYVRVRQSNDANEAISSPIFISGTANQPPTVSITSPASGAVFTVGDAVSITATASDIDGSVAKVEFLKDGQIIGEDTSSPYSFTWSEATAGNYSLTAKVTDNLGAITTSASVAITVNPANQPPTVNMTSPTNGAQFDAGSTITLTASALDADGTITSVVFYQGTTKIGVGNSSGSGVYTYAWSGVQAGTYSLTARATDNLGGTATSTAVSITVTHVNQPPTVTITSPVNNTSVIVGNTVNMVANATDDVSVASVEFFVNGTSIGTDNTSPYGATWNAAATGTYTVTATAIDNQLANSISNPVTIQVINIPANVSVSSSIVAGSDDAEEYKTGAVYLNHTILNLVYESKTSGNQTVGLRFTGVAIPQGATITKASVQFTASGISIGKCALVIKGQAIDDAPAFTSDSRNLSGRTKTVASVSWAPGEWTSGTYDSPDLKAVIQEVIGREGWKEGYSLALLITGSGTRNAVSYEGGSTSAPKLLVEYTLIKNGSLKAVSQDLPDISPILADEITLFPNPVNDLLTLRFTPETRVEEVMIYSSGGSLVKTIKYGQNLVETSIDCSSLKPGTYLLTVRTDSGRKTLKFIRQ